MRPRSPTARPPGDLALLRGCGRFPPIQASFGGSAPNGLGMRLAIGRTQAVESAVWRDGSDAELVAGVVLRSEDAYAELYRRLARSVNAASRMILGSSPEVEDVVAEVFVGFWLRPELFDPGRSSVLGFLRMKARGRSIDILRTKTARRLREDRVGREASPSGLEAESGMIATESAAQVHNAVSLLPPLEREVIRLAFFNAMTYVEVARALGIAEGTAKSRIRSGLQHLAANVDIQSQRQPQQHSRIGQDIGAPGGRP